MKETLAIGWGIWAPIAMVLLNYLVVYPLLAVGLLMEWIGTQTWHFAIWLSEKCDEIAVRAMD